MGAPLFSSILDHRIPDKQSKKHPLGYCKLRAHTCIGLITDTYQPQGRWGWLNQPLNEPKAPEVQEYINATPNKGLLRYAGVFGQQRLLITNREGFGEVLQEKSYIFHKWDVTKRVLGPLMGDGLLLQEDDPHKVRRKSKDLDGYQRLFMISR